MIIGPFIFFFPNGLYYYLQSTFGFYNIPILAIILVGIFSKRATAFAAKTALIVYIIAYGIYMIFGTHINFLYILTIYFPLLVGLILVISYYKPRETDYIQEYTKQVDITPWKHLKVFSIVLALCIACIYFLFSNPGVRLVEKLLT